MTTFPDSVPRQQFVGEVQKSGVEPERITLFVVEVAKLTEAEEAADIEFVDGRYAPGDVRRYGAVVDGVTDDASAWADADAVSNNGGPPIFVPKSSSGMAIASAVSTSIGTDVYFEEGAFLLYTAATEEAALTLGVITGNTSRRIFRNLWVERESQSDWTDEANIGIRALNLVYCHIDIVEVTKFTIGLQVEGNDYGNAYNEYSMKLLSANKVGLKLLSAETSLTAGYCNENRFIGGEFTVWTGVNSTLDRWGIVLDSTRVTKSPPNSNYFLKPSFELNAADASGTARPILINYGLYSKFEHCRDEGNDQPFMECENDSEDNYATTTTTAGSAVQNDGDFDANFVDSIRLGWLSKHRSTYLSGLLPRISNEYDGAGQVYIPGCSQRNSTNGNQSMALTLLVVDDDYLEIPSTRGVGVMIDTANIKRFVFRKDVEAGFGGRLVVVPYDTNATQLTTDGSYVRGTGATGFTHSSNVGGSYSTGSDSDGDRWFSVTSDVHFVWVGTFGGTAVARLRSFEIQAQDDGAMSVFQGYLDVSSDPFPNDFHNYCTADPANATAGPNYPAGKQLKTFNVGTGGVPGVVCITQGLGGTAAWENEAVLS